MNYLALCCIVRDETPFLREWLAFHALLGVERFFLYDNESRIPVRETLQDFAEEDLVTILPYAGRARQMPAYQDCLQRFGPDFRWIGFLDADEFVCPMLDNDIRLLLAEFEEYAALAVNWNLFSSMGDQGWHLARPKGLVLENYTRRFPYNLQGTDIHIKSFVRPDLTVAARNPHYFQYAPGACCVNAVHFPVSGSSFSFCHYDKVKLNHYFYRSQQDFAEKIAKGNADNNSVQRDMDMFYRQTRLKTEEDRDILRFAPAVNNMLQGGRLRRAARYVPAGAGYDAYMDAAMEFMRAGQTDKAGITLCHAALEHGHMGDLWLLRAMLARQSGRLERAERFLRKSATLEESPLLYRELAALRRGQQREREAADIDAFLAFRSEIS